MKRNWKQLIQRRIRPLVFLVTCLLVLVYYSLSFYVAFPLESMHLYEGLRTETVDPRQGCQIPLNHPFDPEVVSYFKPPISVQCKSRTSLLTYIDTEGYLKYNTTAFQESGYSTNDLSCSYQEILRGAKDGEVLYSEVKAMSGIDRPESDFVRVSCSRFSWLPDRYTMYHAAVKPNPTVRKFMDDEELGVVVVGLDSLSRLNFMRQLPKSYAVLTETLGAIIFKGFNKVGHNTLPNIVPILTGNPPLDTSVSASFDDWPFLWKPLKADGVATLYGEDRPDIATFMFWGAGFEKDPTHHYFNRYWSATESAALNYFSSPMCLGPLPKHRIFLDYLTSFLRAYKESPTFMFTLDNEPCHDHMNNVGIVDEDLYQFLLNGFNEGLFNRTALLLLGDHGHRMDVFRQTPQGELEDFMPLVSMTLPPWFSKKHPELMRVLEGNVKRLSSSYDLYSTFTHIFQKLNKKHGKPEYDFSQPKYGQSLFRPIALNRTCSDAGIPDKYCICKHDSEQLALSDRRVVNSLRIIEELINNEILNEKSRLWKTVLSKYAAKMNQHGEDMDVVKETSMCAKLTIYKVDEARFIQRSNEVVYLKFWTYPNNGLYEARVSQNALTNFTVGRNVSLGNDDDISIDRINRYGTQSDCLSRALLIMVPLIRSVCFCT